jgi:hypothetical protein
MKNANLKQMRKININALQEHKYPDNTIKTAKYNM